MITVEKRENTQTNYLKLWCETCRRTLKLLDYGIKEVVPGGIELLDSMATKHETRNRGHKIFIFEGSRLPTNQELR